MKSGAPKTLKQSTRKAILVLTLGLTVYLTDHAQITSASTFEGGLNSMSRKNPLRLPSNVANSTLDFDCKSSVEHIDMTTEFEAVRLEVKNCDDKLQVENPKLKNHLATFSRGDNKYSSEYAYLRRGENSFVLTSGKKSFTVSIFRF